MADPPAHPGDAYDNDCKYDDVPFTDCDPFHLVKWRQMKLVFGGSHCESYKNETKRCSSEDFPPGMIDIVQKKTELDPNLTINKESTIFEPSSRNLVKMSSQRAGPFHQVS